MHTQRNTHTHTHTHTHARTRARAHTHNEQREKDRDWETAESGGRQTDRQRLRERWYIHLVDCPSWRGTGGWDRQTDRQTDRDRDRFFPKSFAGQENTSPTPSPRRKRPQSHCLKARLTPSWETLQCQERFTYILVKERSHRTSEWLSDEPCQAADFKTPTTCLAWSAWPTTLSDYTSHALHQSRC